MHTNLYGGGEESCHCSLEFGGKRKFMDLTLISESCLDTALAEELEAGHTLRYPRRVYVTTHSQEQALVIVAPRQSRDRFSLASRSHFNIKKKHTSEKIRIMHHVGVVSSMRF